MNPMEPYGRRWKEMEGDGRRWKEMENYGKRWKTMESDITMPLQETYGITIVTPLDLVL